MTTRSEDAGVPGGWRDVRDGEAAFVRALGRRLLLARQGLEWTQAQLAEAAGLSRNFIGGLERGMHSASIVHLRRLAIALGLDVHDLIPCDADQA